MIDYKAINSSRYETLQCTILPQQVKNIVIVGSGPVGSFLATLFAYLGCNVTLYKKWKEISLTANLEIEESFFMEVHKVLSRLNIETQFFKNLNKFLQDQQNRVCTKNLEEKFIEEAKSQGAKCKIKEIESFKEIHEEHKDLNPIIIDCAGKHSKLRINEFGPDEDNIVTTPLQYVLCISFKAKVTSNVPTLYQVINYIKPVKLTEVVISKRKDSNGFSDVMLPVYITNELAYIFDTIHTKINKVPLNPFYSKHSVPDIMLFPIYSLIGNLIVNGYTVDLSSVEVKKIEVSCGYAKKRSKNNYICLGDSAVHLAFSRSLNLGLKHAFDFFIRLSTFVGYQVQTDDRIIRKFKEHYSYSNPVKVYPTVARNVFLVVTKMIWYGCYSYCLTNHNIKRLTSHFGIYEYEISDILNELNKNLGKWHNLIADFEAKRDEDINIEVNYNKQKSTHCDYLSWFIGINDKSFIKNTQLSHAVRGKHLLCKKDFELLLKYFKARQNIMVNNNGDIIVTLLKYLSSKEFNVFKRIYENKNLPNEEKTRLIKDIINTKYREPLYSSDGLIIALIRNELAQGKT